MLKPFNCFFVLTKFSRPLGKTPMGPAEFEQIPACEHLPRQNPPVTVLLNNCNYLNHVQKWRKSADCWSSRAEADLL